MENQIKILEILNQKQNKLAQLKSLTYGSIEIRNKDNNKYIYTHKKDNGLQITEYIGEYNEELYNLIVSNNMKAKSLKKEIKKLEKDLKELNYHDKSLSKKVEKNIDYAKRHLADTIYKQARLEGVATTLSDTEDIIEGAKVSNMSPEDILKIVNLKHAWEFILNENVITSQTDYSILCMINKLIEEGFYYNAGKLRTTPVKIGGTSWQPQIPIESDIKEDLGKILNQKKAIIDIAIDLLLYVTKKQMFIDGNKRTSVIFVNHFIISKGKGLIVIPTSKIEKYKKLLIEYYEKDNKEEIYEFIKNDCYLTLN